VVIGALILGGLVAVALGALLRSLLPAFAVVMAIALVGMWLRGPEAAQEAIRTPPAMVVAPEVPPATQPPPRTPYGAMSTIPQGQAERDAAAILRAMVARAHQRRNLDR
jgi:hypothetical protein